MEIESFKQLSLFADGKPEEKEKEGCAEHIGFMSTAHVPNGLFCSSCNMIVSRLLPPPKNEPEIIGYVSATWAWKYESGLEWTNDFKQTG